MTNKIINKNQHNIKTKTLECCCYCGYPYLNKKLIKCSGKGCNNRVCYNCSINVQDKPFCPDCMIKLMKEDVVFIITKRNNI